MSFQAYEQYKPVKGHWFREVPSHWDIVSIKWLSPVQRGASPRPIDDPKYFDDGGEYAWVRIADVSNATDGQLLTTSQRLSDLGSSLSVKIKPGELFVSIAGTVGKPCIAKIKACIHDGFVYFPRLEINPLFLFRIFESGLCYGGLGKWGTQLNLNTDTVGAIRIPVPPTEELENVVTFLDRETSKIDGLVAEQRLLIALLKEKRQAVISHAVTKGLNPGVPMKPSGIPWLGDVPKHWEVKPLRRFDCHVQTGPFGSQLHSHEYVMGGTPVINPTHMVNGRIVPSDDITVHEDVLNRLPHQRLRKGDVVFSRRGELGRCALVTDCEAGWLCGTGSMILRLHETQYVGGYLSLFLSLDVLRQYFESFSIGSVMNSLSSETLLSMPLVVPPLHEQTDIVEFAARQADAVDSLVEDTERAIQLLQERRTALISAAVTGKIDVREVATKEEVA